MWLNYVVLSCLVALSQQKSTPQDDHYIAAAVEYEVSGNVEQNKQNYIRLIGEAAAQNADIVVFPELTLTNGTTSFPVPFHGLLKTYPIPALHADLYDDLLVSMSSAARQNQVYLLVNVRELMDCTKNDTGEECPEAKQYIFNTNVVFDRTGAVIDRYRKINLFGEYSHTPALHPDLGIFTTDFGVKFGHFVCFDLMFQIPSIQIVQKEQITDILFATMWFSEMPFLTAAQIQEAYAYAMNVNFIAAGANNVERGSTGSGIFSGKAGALVSVMTGAPLTKVLVAKVPKIPGQVVDPVQGPIYDDPTVLDKLTLITDPSLPSHVSKLLSNGYQEFTLVDRDVSCTFKVRLNQNDGDGEPHYRAFVHDGSNTYARRQIGIASCLVVACKTTEPKSCAYRYNAATTQTIIEEMQINMRTYTHQQNTTLQCDNVAYFPSSYTTTKYPINPENITYIDSEQNNLINEANEVQKKDRDDIIFKIKQPQNDIISFGIWGRLFNRDVDHRKEITEGDIKQFNTILDIIYGSDINTA